ncbi:MAG: cytochrome c [Deltaproteobacteria bacterium]|nr:cytochrome c [Deltaproteobacteria bacterium]
MAALRSFLALSLATAAAAAAGLVASACSDDATAPIGVADAGDAATDRTTPFTDVEDITCVSCVPEDASAMTVPAPYAGRTNPLGASASAVQNGASFFAGRCALCHGTTGKGDGLEGPSDVRAADLTATRRADDHLFWRISEGGRNAPFCSSMPSFSYLTETQRWELVAFVQSIAPRPIDADAGSDAGDAATSD